MGLNLTGSPNLSGLENKKHVYQHDLLIAQGRIPEAQQVMALLKERNTNFFHRLNHERKICCLI